MRHGYFVVTDDTMAALAFEDPDSARCAGYAEQHEEDVEAEHIVAFLEELAALAAGASADGRHLYCTISL